MHVVKQYRSEISLAPSATANLAVIGAEGFNFKQRIEKEVLNHRGRIAAIAYDLKAPASEPAAGIRRVQVRDNGDLARRLGEQRPTHVLIESTDADHLEHIQIALESGAQCILCEKCIASRARDAVDFAPLKNGLPGNPFVGIIDHYLLLGLVLNLYAHTEEWLGQVRRVQVALLEAKGVSAAQVHSHRNGMTNFFYHTVGLGGLWLNLNELTPLEAAWAKHPDEEVPDTYRWGRFGVARTGAILEGMVGKRMPKPQRRISVEGDKGHAVIDRDQNELRVTTAGRSFCIPGPDNDTGYASLVAALANGSPLPMLHDPTQAVLALHLVEAARAIAQEVPIYAATGQPPAGFVSDWQLLPAAMSS